MKIKQGWPYIWAEIYIFVMFVGRPLDVAWFRVIWGSNKGSYDFKQREPNMCGVSGDLRVSMYFFPNDKRGHIAQPDYGIRWCAQVKGHARILMCEFRNIIWVLLLLPAPDCRLTSPWPYCSLHLMSCVFYCHCHCLTSVCSVCPSQYPSHDMFE